MYVCVCVCVQTRAYVCVCVCGAPTGVNRGEAGVQSTAILHVCTEELSLHIVGHDGTEAHHHQQPHRNVEKHHEHHLWMGGGGR